MKRVQNETEDFESGFGFSGKRHSNDFCSKNQFPFRQLSVSLLFMTLNVFFIALLFNMQNNVIFIMRPFNLSLVTNGSSRCRSNPMNFLF